jgi:hypothetical protein
MFNHTPEDTIKIFVRTYALYISTTIFKDIKIDMNTYTHTYIYIHYNIYNNQKPFLITYDLNSAHYIQNFQ